MVYTFCRIGLKKDKVFSEIWLCRTKTLTWDVIFLSMAWSGFAYQKLDFQVLNWVTVLIKAWAAPPTPPPNIRARYPTAPPGTLTWSDRDSFVNMKMVKLSKYKDREYGTEFLMTYLKDLVNNIYIIMHVCKLCLCLLRCRCVSMYV